MLALLLLFLALTVVCASLLTGKPNPDLSLDGIAQDADLVWEKTYGGAGDDRAFFAARAGDGYLVVGSSSSFSQDNRTAAWAMRIDESGNSIWNQTFMENSGAEFRYTLTLDDGFLLVETHFCLQVTLRAMWCA